jgi:hypothetical protein
MTTLKFLDHATKYQYASSEAPDELQVPPVGSEILIEFEDGSRLFKVVRNRFMILQDRVTMDVECYIQFVGDPT